MTAPEPLSGVVVDGDRVKSLEALRDRLATEIDKTGSARDVAALSQRLMDVLEQIDKLTPGESGGTVLDELAKRRSSKVPAAGSRSAKVPSQRR